MRNVFLFWSFRLSNRVINLWKRWMRYYAPWVVAEDVLVLGPQQGHLIFQLLVHFQLGPKVQSGGQAALAHPTIPAAVQLKWPRVWNRLLSSTHHQAFHPHPAIQVEFLQH